MLTLRENTLNGKPRNIEHSIFVTMNKETGTISSIPGPSGKNDEIIFDLNKSGAGYETDDGESIIIAIGHSHTAPKVGGLENSSGTSEKDRKFAMDTGITVYSIDAFHKNSPPIVGSVNETGQSELGLDVKKIGTHTLNTIKSTSQ